MRTSRNSGSVCTSKRIVIVTNLSLHSITIRIGIGVIKIQKENGIIKPKLLWRIVTVDRSSCLRVRPLTGDRASFNLFGTEEKKQDHYYIVYQNRERKLFD